MKITYDMQEDEDREVMAFVDVVGNLCIKDDAGESIMITESGAYLGSSGFQEWMDACEVKKRFYKGDSVTITF